jgi:uncharacterized protein
MKNLIKMNNNIGSPDDQSLIDKTVEYVKNELRNAEGGHDWFHINRVWKNAVYIAQKEQKGNLLIIQLAALLHDIADAKFHNGDEEIGPRIARNYLNSAQLPDSIIEHIIQIIENISFRKRNEKNDFNSVELEIVQDADRLDALGAIGIARVFNYGGFKNRPIYDPIDPSENGLLDSEANKRHTIGHFYDKLLLLSGMMNTSTGKRIADERHLFMVKFLEQFYKETEGPQ